jgi:hypothetical protein
MTYLQGTRSPTPRYRAPTAAKTSTRRLNLPTHPGSDEGGVDRTVQFAGPGTAWIVPLFDEIFDYAGRVPDAAQVTVVGNALARCSWPRPRRQSWPRRRKSTSRSRISIPRPARLSPPCYPSSSVPSMSSGAGRNRHGVRVPYLAMPYSLMVSMADAFWVPRPCFGKPKGKA